MARAYAISAEAVAAEAERTGGNFDEVDVSSIVQLDEIEHLIACQVGALLGVAALVRARRAAGGDAAAEVTHVKPHGALNNLACVDASVAAAITRGVAGVDPGLIMLAPVRAALASMRP